MVKDYSPCLQNRTLSTTSSIFSDELKARKYPYPLSRIECVLLFTWISYAILYYNVSLKFPRQGNQFNRIPSAEISNPVFRSGPFGQTISPHPSPLER